MAAGGVEALLYESLVQDLSALLGDTDSHDLQLRVGAKGELIGAHRLILLCRCAAELPAPEHFFSARVPTCAVRDLSPAHVLATHSCPCLCVCRCERLRSRRREWLSGGKAETEIFHLEGFGAKTVRSVLKYVYTGKVRPASTKGLLVACL